MESARGSVAPWRERWEPEAELRRAPPRPVRPRGGSMGCRDRACAGCGLGFLTALGLIVLLTAAHSSLTAALGALVPGVVSGGRRVRYGDFDVDYTYRWRSKTYRGSSRVRRDEVARLPIGAPVRVRIWTKAPAYGSYLADAGPPTWLTAWALWGLAGIINAPLGVFWWSVWRSALGPSRFEKRLVSRGVAAPAVVYRCPPRQTARDARILFFEFAVPAAPGAGSGLGSDNGTDGGSGAWRVQGRQAVSPDAWDTVRDGSVMTALYDARRPQRCALYRFLNHQAV